MKSALVVNVLLSLVLLVPILLIKRRSWYFAHVWLASASTIIFAACVLINLNLIPEFWCGIIAFSFILKNLGLLSIFLQTKIHNQASQAKDGKSPFRNRSAALEHVGHVAVAWLSADSAEIDLDEINGKKPKA